MTKKTVKLIIILCSAAVLILVILLPIDQYLISKSNNLLVSLLAETLLYWALLLMSGAILISFSVDNNGDFVATLDLSDLASGLMYACFIAYGVNLIFTSSFKISDAENLKNYSGSPVTVISKKLLYINGPIGSLTFETLKQIAEGSDIKALELNSSGGLIDTALNIASFIAKNKIITVVKGQCASACVLIAISGQQLIVSPNAKFGFHNASSISQPESELGKYNSMLASEAMFAFLKKGGIPSDIIKKAEATPANEMYYVKGADLISQGLAIQIEQ